MKRLLPLLLVSLLAAPAGAQIVPALAPGQTVIDPDEDGRISGDIFDARTNLPQAGSVIALYHPRNLSDRVWPEPWVPDFPAEDDTPVATVRAASEGQFLFDGLAPGLYRVAPLVAAGSQVTTFEVVITREDPSEYVTLRTNMGGVLTGRVVGTDGVGISGLFVYVAGMDDGAGGNIFAGRPPNPRAVTREDGSFSLADVPPGDLHVQAGRQDFGFSPLRPLTIGVADDVTDLQFVVPDERERIERGREARGGLGVVVDFDRFGVRIRRLMPGFPAEKAGLLPGDRILALDGLSTLWMIRFEFFSRARGEIDEPITLTVQRGDEAPFDVTVRRAQMPAR